MYSLISKRIYAVCRAKELNGYCLESSVFPTPVGPTKRKLPIGRLGVPSPTRLRRMALAILSTASSWPMTWALRSSSQMDQLRLFFFFEIANRDIGFCSMICSIRFSLMTGSILICDHVVSAFPCISQFGHGNKQPFQSLLRVSLELWDFPLQLSAGRSLLGSTKFRVRFILDPASSNRSIAFVWQEAILDVAVWKNSCASMAPSV